MKNNRLAILLLLAAITLFICTLFDRPNANELYIKNRKNIRSHLVLDQNQLN